MDKRVVAVCLILAVSVLVGASVFSSDEDDSPAGEPWEQSITGIDGTNSVHIHVDPANNTILVVGFTPRGRETFTILRSIEV